MLREFTLTSLSVGGDSVVLQIHLATIVIVVIILLSVWFFSESKVRSFRGHKVEIEKAELGLGTGTITIRPNSKDKQVAYSIWVELSTRKIGLPINLDDDIIVEIYNSWYEFFKITRELIKDIPVNHIKDESTHAIVNLSIELLNEGLRPHLGKWQARFRYWHEAKTAMNPTDIDPQAIQKKYPLFEELRADMEKVNQHLMKYRSKMSDLFQS